MMNRSLDRSRFKVTFDVLEHVQIEISNLLDFFYTTKVQCVYYTINNEW
jgi:hypothetical protein